MDSSEIASLESVLDLSELDKPATMPSSIKRIRDVHHRIARRVAEGLGTTEIAQQLGYSISRISILKGDPAFQQLVEVYRKRLNEIEDEVWAGFQKRALMIASDGLEIIQARQEEEGETMPFSELRANVEMALDRAGLSVVHKSVNASVDFSYLADREALGRRRQAQLSAPHPSQGAPKVGATSQPAGSSPPQLKVVTDGPDGD